ncbi:Uncharacterized protein OS=Blastopirellula marina DSM 3645 GN=DSM3645_06674 PE=4 SV=1: DUF1573 [Gemmata massiliana]|uniref:DUF1573 domain-containing protein n=1 Tax=Gemmata massiliana TaxID=1210884 RepID=A0A6P2D503_9BACT|nr:DUF1573 domain-containing protein [Gemmata massiliana]VTR95566.1 Uncharacterized protein OS=Blastopirellula marina DSM 3645 GN=DSM3645_06674 PE=4 SV=1: DUF1573 [Gemmata massiliana]
MNTLILLSALATGQPAPLAPATFHSPAPVAAKGDTKAGPPLLHTFDLTNATAGTVTITKVEAGCGCLRQALAAEVLQAGEKTKLALEVNTLAQPDGPNRWQATVSYKVEQPGVPARTGELLLQLTATLSREISVTPPQVAFSAAGEVSKELIVGDKRAKPLTVLKTASSATHLTVEIGQVTNGTAGRTQPITIKLAANAPTGHRDESVVLYTDDADCPELRIPVRVLKRAVGAVTATPEAVSVRLAAGQTEVSTLVQLRSPDGKAVSIAGAESDLPAVQVKCSTGSGPVATVRITVPETVAAQPGRCTVRVRMNDQGDEVSIPVSWTGKK